MNEPVVGVLALQGDVREHIDVLRACGAEAVRVRRPTELDRVDALVIPGGESTTMDKLVRGFDLYEPLRERIKRGLPVLGSCAGMILLADRIVDAPPDQQTLGGLDVTVRRNAFGRQVESFEADIVFAGLEDGKLLAGVDDTDAAVLALNERFEVAVLTRGSEGVSVSERGGSFSLEIEALPVVDPTGAGDAFCAGFLESWIRDWDVRSAAEAGVDLAAEAVGVLGGRPV